MSEFERFRHGVLLCVMVLGVTLSAQQGAPPRPAAPVEAITGILDVLRSHQLVALGDAHGNEQVHAVRLALIRDPRFATVVNDIVVEFGSGRYQSLMDRFVNGRRAHHWAEYRGARGKHPLVRAQNFHRVEP